MNASFNPKISSQALPAHFLVFNCGSSSLTFKVFEARSESDVCEILSGKGHRVGVKGSEPSFIEFRYQGQKEKLEAPLPSHGRAAQLVLDKLQSISMRIDLIGHRWTHSGGVFRTSWLDEDLLSKLEQLLPLFPIHHPAMLSVIHRCLRVCPSLPQYITTDNAFHHTIPEHAYTYALPRKLIEEQNFRKYGFHGLSYQYVINEASAYLDKPLSESKIIACHLGTGGSSVAAVEHGQSIDTSMGYTGLPGLVMSTRSGDIDPMITLYLTSTYDCRIDQVNDLLNKKSGLLGLTGFSSDLRDIISKMPHQNTQALMAFDMYVRRVKKYIGSYVLELGGVDLLLFTDDIGLRNHLVREHVCRDMRWCGIHLDTDLNRSAPDDRTSEIQSKDSAVKILAMPTEEEKVICWEGLKLMRGGSHVDL